MPNTEANERRYTLYIDVHLTFEPPMADKQPGIVLTNTVELPFVPTTGLIITGRMFNDPPISEGVPLKELTWDVDRQSFWAYFEHGYVDFPILCIPQEIQYWLDRGWKFGSYADSYEEKRGRKPRKTSIDCGEIPEIDDEEAERLPTMDPRKRPQYFNVLMQALAREMAILYNNSSVAYAMDKTKLFFGEQKSKEAETPQMKKFFAAVEEFNNMPFDKQYDWRERIARRNPRLDQFVGPSRR